MTHKRIIDQLRREYGGDWRWDQDKGCWIGPIGEVRAYSNYSPRFDGDDNNFIATYVDAIGNTIGMHKTIFAKKWGGRSPCR